MKLILEIHSLINIQKHTMLYIRLAKIRDKLHTITIDAEKH